MRWRAAVIKVSLFLLTPGFSPVKNALLRL
jgi:hypothetical protein